MTSYKCYQCKRLLDDVIGMYICYVCEKIICIRCLHCHSTLKENDDSLKQIIKDKSTIAYDLILSFYNFDSLGYPHNKTFLDLNYDEVEENRKMLKQYVDIKYKGLGDYKSFCDPQCLLGRNRGGRVGGRRGDDEAGGRPSGGLDVPQEGAPDGDGG